MNYIITISMIVILTLGGIFFLSKENNLMPDKKDESGSIDSSAGSLNINYSDNILDLSNKNLTKVPDSVFGQKSIEVLNVSNNNLSGSLQAEVRHLQNLRSLDLSDNNFTGIPAEVGQLSNLEVLDVSNNPITGLPYEIGNLKKLKVFDLRGTSYSEQDLEIIKKGLSVNVEIIVD